MRRREFVLATAILPWLLQGCGGGSGASDSADNSGDSGGGGGTPPPVAAKPNVLFISIDDLNDWTGFLRGHPQVQTPNMDRLAGLSTVFAKAYCNAPLCNPSRSSALTGLMPTQTQVYDNNTRFRTTLPTVTTLPQHFLNNGYYTLSLGKVFHYGDTASWSRTVARADDVLPSTSPVANSQCYDQGAESPAGYFDWAPLTVSDGETADGKAASSAIEFLQQTQAQPFFLALGFSRPHLGWYVPQAYFDQYPLDTLVLPEAYANDRDDLPATALDWLGNAHEACIVEQDLWPDAVQAYLASISFVDAQLGKVLDALEASAHANNTIVVLWSDNGYHLGEKFKWQKGALWERSTHIPLLVKAIGQTTQRLVPHCVSLVDLYPTLLDMCELTTVSGLAGRSIKALVDGSVNEWPHPVVITHGASNHAVRKNDWRYIRYADGSTELYDHQTDLNEWFNLSGKAEYAAVIAELQQYLPV